LTRCLDIKNMYILNKIVLVLFYGQWMVKGKSWLSIIFRCEFKFFSSNCASNTDFKHNSKTEASLKISQIILIGQYAIYRILKIAKNFIAKNITSRIWACNFPTLFREGERASDFFQFETCYIHCNNQYILS